MNESLWFKVCLVVFAVILVGTRVYNIDRTARFTQDESSDLARMHQYYQDNRLTLVGPISNDNTKVFGSLTYYMLMPFAVLGDFTPVSPVYGTAFWGIITALLLITLTYKLNKSILIPISLLILIWHPLLVTSRWAWNPHLVPFWIALGVLFYLKQSKWSLFLAGIFLSLSFHNHYIAILATATFSGLACLKLYRSQKIRHIAYLVVGYIIPFSAFIAFDIKNPPGLFFGSYLSGGSTPHIDSATPFEYFSRLQESVMQSGFSMIEQAYIVIPVLILLILLIVSDIKQMSKHLFWIAPALVQVIGGLVLDGYSTRYFLPAIVFVLIYLILPRKDKLAQKISYLILMLFFIGSLISLPRNILETRIHPDVYSVNLITREISQRVKDGLAPNPNVAVLASPDKSPLGHIYRDTLSIHGVQVRAISEYDVSESLFVISTSTLEQVLNDDAVAMAYFREARLEDVIPIPNSSWVIYWFKY